MKYLLLSFLTISIVGHGSERPLFISLNQSITLLGSKTKKNLSIRPTKNTKLKIIGQKGWAYIVQVENNGILAPQEFLTSRQWLDKMMIAQNLQGLSNLEQQTSPSQKVCPPPNSNSNQNWKSGCHVLAKGENLTQKDHSGLKKCISSIQAFITNNGKIKIRDKIFPRLYKLKSEERRFAAMIFTIQGESHSLASENYPPQGPPPNLEEMWAVMKVIDNRLRNANENHEQNPKSPFSELDIVLDKQQFSMYNPKRLDDWPQILRPGGANTNFTYAIQAFIGYPKVDFGPRPKVDHTYHYHTNFVGPKKIWGNSTRCGRDAHLKYRIPITVNDEPLKQARHLFDEKTAYGRSRIKQYIKHTRHLFFYAVDQCGRIGPGLDTWTREVITEWRD